MTAGFQPAVRLAEVGVSEILARAAATEALRRAGRPVLSLTAGEPDFDTPDDIKAAACRAIDEGRTKYTALDGSPELKAAVQHKFHSDNGLSYALSEITCSAGAKQVIHNAFMATLDPGDEVILPAPYWTSYADIVRLAGARVVAVACDEAAGFRLTPNQLEAAITPATRWVLLNSPSNPSGSAYDAAALAGLAEVLRRHPRVWVLSDDIYEHVLYDGRAFATLAQAAPDLRSRTLTVNGVSKAYAMTGWRIGYGAGPAPLIAAMAVVQSQSTSCPSSISQAAAVAALVGGQEVVRLRAAAFQARRDFVVEALNSVSGLTCRRPEGAFYAFVGCDGLIGARRPDGGILRDDSAVADYLLDWDVSVVPGACFGLSPFFRISYATSQDNLRLAMQRIADACAGLEPAAA